MNRVPCAFLLLLAATGSPGAQEVPSPVKFTRELRAGDATYQADFGRLDVPLDRSRAESPALSLAFVRLRSTAAAPGPPLFFLNGIPGGASALREDPLWGRYLELGDVVLIDQRGSGESRPRLVWESPAWRPELLFGDEGTARRHVLECAALARREWAENGVDLGAFHTVESAADVDALRRALGYERIHVLGHSAGTHLGQELVRRHGEHVARFVSLGTAGMNDIQKLPAELDLSLRRVARLAAADPGVGAGLPDLAATFSGLLERLAREPLVVSVADPRGDRRLDVSLGPFGLQLLVLLDLGDTVDLPLLPRLLLSLERRETGLVRWFLEKRLRQNAAMPLLLFASRGASGATAERWRRIDEQARTSLFGRVRSLFSPELDPVLGTVDLGDAFRAPVESAVPALFVSGSLDANTPPAQAEAVRRGFRRSWHVVLENGGHDDLLTSEAVRERILAFLAGDEPADETIPGPPLVFVPFEGAHPTPTHPALEEAG